MAATRHHLAPACQGGWQRAHQGMSQQGFARTALPDQGQGGAGMNGEIQRLQQGFLAIIDLQPLDMNGRHEVAPCEDGMSRPRV